MSVTLTSNSITLRKSGSWISRVTRVNNDLCDNNILVKVWRLEHYLSETMEEIGNLQQFGSILCYRELGNNRYILLYSDMWDENSLSVDRSISFRYLIGKSPLLTIKDAKKH